MDEGLKKPLTLVSASAGFGKTTLLSVWSAGCGQSIAWLSLDEADSDPSRFLAYLVAALQTVQSDLGESVVTALQTPRPPPFEDLLTALLNEIAAYPGRLALVLDDYHTLDSPAVDAAIAFLTDHFPPQFHLVIASREDPNLPLPRLRARGQLTELRAEDLRFTPAEAADFLTRAMGLDLTGTEIAALEERTEGWIAGLQLAALAMQEEDDTAGFIQSFTGSNRFVLDYLLEEVLQRQPPAIQDFLMRTSILDRMCGPLCDAVLDVPPGCGQQTLESLERANLFIIPLDNERRWYRYHHLFGGLLRQRLASLPPSALPNRGQRERDLNLRASQWLESDGDLAAAFRHAHAAGEHERAAQLAEEAWKGMSDTFQTAAWLEWVNLIPAAVVCARPSLCIRAASALADNGSLAASEARLQDAERALAHAPDPSLSARIALARAYNAQVQDDLPETIRQAEMALQIIPSGDVMQRAQAAIMLEFTHWSSGDLEAALAAMDDWMDSMTELGNHVFVVASAFAAADLLVGLGRLGEAEQAYQHALDLASRYGPQAEHITAHHHLGLSMLYRQRGQDDLAAHHWQMADERGQQTTLIDWPHRWCVAQAQLKEAAGELDAALELLDEAARVYVKNPVPDLRPIPALKARIHLKQGQTDKAWAWAAGRGLSPGDAGGYLAEFELLTLARLENANPRVNALLERLLTAAEGQNRLDSVLEILLTQSLVYEAQSSRPRALAALERALTLAERLGYLRVFVDEGQSMRSLIADFRLQLEKRDHPLRGYIDRLLAAFPPQPSVHQGVEAASLLSSRELEILRLVAEGLSNTDISRRLFLALSTVKGHNLRIFDKLQARNRTEAVARARELGLL
jgi:LuxR family maltose regulon positive regulatory protein